MNVENLSSILMKPAYFKMKIAILCFMFLQTAAAQNLRVHDLTCEYLRNPVGIDILKPRLSWKLSSPRRNVLQSAYEIRVSHTSNDLIRGNKIVWGTGKVASSRSVHIGYDGPALESGKRYYWQVRAWDQSGKPSGWSEPAYWQMGLLLPGDWSAKWIASDEQTEGAPMFRKKLSISKEVRSAVMYITAKGLYEAFINGKRVGDQYFTPGWTSYKKRIQYQTYDVTDMLKSGGNSIGMFLGGGWYHGSISKNGKKYWYGDQPGLLMQLEIDYRDGTHDVIISDETWKTAPGPIRYTDIYNGETYDAQQEKVAWTDPTYAEDDSWHPVQLLDKGTETLIGVSAPPVRKHEEFKVRQLIRTPKGETVVDFGQNLVGWVRIKAKGPAGTVITISHAEVLDKDGNFYTANLRAAKQENKYILKGGAEEEFEPHFTFQGFRYARIEGYPGALDIENVSAVAMYSDLEQTGRLSTSNAKLNQLQHNIEWGQKGNFLDIPTDCNQRDERLGWTGDASPFFRTASFNMNVASFFTKWLGDLKADQHPNGSVPYVIPNVRNWGSGVAGWDDAATIVPWDLYVVYGDKRILENQYESMKAWVKYMTDNSTNGLWNPGFQFGDWLSYWPDDRLFVEPAVTDKFLIAQAFYVHSTRILLKTCNILGRKAEAEEYSLLLEKVKDAFRREFVTPAGRMASDTQTAYVLALNFDIMPGSERQQIAERLVANIERYGHLTTGFLGTPYLCFTLTRFGYTELAYTLLLREKYPSWLYQVNMGATTIWERWDGVKADSTLQNPEMNSFNHYHYGVIGEWMYRVLAGIDTDETPEGVGFRMSRIAPRPGGNLKSAKATFTTMYGTIGSEWRLNDGKFILEVIIPPNTTGRIVLPNAANKIVFENQRDIKTVSDVRDISRSGSNLELTIGSGNYQFEYEF